MSKRLYIKLAWTGMKKNKQLYVPYLIAGMAMVMVFYIFNFLSTSKVVASLPGREVLPILFNCGAGAMGLFSIPFLFYTNASLIKKRKKELGLYNILGMNKRNIFAVLFWETVITYGIVIVGGLFAGILFSKLAELGLVNMMEKPVNYHIYVAWGSTWRAIWVFAVIYFLILLNALHQIHKNNPIELLHSEVEGERPPKSRLLPTIISLIFILCAYYIVATLEVPMNFGKVFIAGVLLTIGTYLLFICALVYVCKKLQSNKQYYYKTAHFVTVSTMTYRMKRNGASLATLCILATMILVSFTFSVTFYVGAIDTANKHYPYDSGLTIEVPLDKISDEVSQGVYTKDLKAEIEGVMADAKDAQSVTAYSANLLAVIKEGRLDLSRNMHETWFTMGYYNGWERGNEKIVYVHVIDLATYNALCQTSEMLKDDEVFIASETVHYEAKDMIRYNGEVVPVKKVVKEIPKMTEVRLDNNSMDSHGCESLFLVVSDLYEFMGAAEGLAQGEANNYLAYHWEYDMNMTGEKTQLNKLYRQIEECVQNMSVVNGNTEVNCYLKSQRIERYYALAGSLLFLAVIINILFVFVTALIMYYKQISEGYEDQKRFAIMRKIGMTKKEIKKTINAQMLMVFVAPLVVAGIHLACTSNVVYLLINFAVVDNKPLMIKVMWICYLGFVIVYGFVYRLTSKTYFRIVNSSVNE